MDIKKKVLVGSVWAVGMRWGTRLIGLASVVVLARVLHPEDFGIMAMAMILVGFLDLFAELGVGIMLIREREISRSDMDTAWTIRVLQGFFLAALLALAAVPAAIYFREPRIEAVVYLCGLSIVLTAFGNIGVVLMRKELDFARDFRYQVITKFIGAAVTVALALLLRNYWALAIAQPCAALLNLVVSYRMHPFRPRFCLRGSRRLLAFSVTIVLSNMATFFANKLDAFIVGRIASPAQMGTYTVAVELSSMPQRELTMSVGRALFPVLAKLKNAGEQMLAVFLEVIGSVVALCLPAGVGLWVVSEDVVKVILGDQWVGTGRLIGILAMYGTLTSLIDIMLGHVLIVTQHERLQSAAYWVRAILLGVCALAAIPWGVEGVAIGATLSSVIMFVVALSILKVTLSCRCVDFLAIFWRPTIAALLMAVAVHYAVSSLDIPALPRLVIGIALGAVAYTSSLLLLWVIVGRPKSAEASALSMVFGRPMTRLG
jgi:O-antigen/teichoic acid export membrane protein